MVKFILGLMAAILAIFLIGCPDNGADTDPPPPDNVIESCDLAVVLLLDRSGSMGGGLLTIMQNSLTTVVQNIESGKWETALVTYEDGSMPPPEWPDSWDLELLTDNNRQELADAINSITASGMSDMSAGLLTSAAMLNESSRKRVLFIFSDGKLCPYGGCDDLITAVNLIKDDDDISIATIGYKLQDDDLDAMKSFASPKPCTDPPEPLFVNAMTEDELKAEMENLVKLLCGMQVVDLSVLPPLITVGSGGTNGGQYTASLIQCGPVSYRIEAAGAFIDAGGVFETSHSSGVLSDASPTLSDKFAVHTTEAMSGEYELILNAVSEDDGSILATAVTIVNVVPITIDVQEVNPPGFNSSTQIVSCKIRIKVSTPEPVTISINPFIYVAGQMSPAPGFEDMNPTQSKDLNAGNHDFPMQISFKKTTAPSGSYDIRVFVGGLGIQKKYEYLGYQLP